MYKKKGSVIDLKHTSKENGLKVLSDGKTIGGRGRLTESAINTLQLVVLWPSNKSKCFNRSTGKEVCYKG